MVLATRKMKTLLKLNTHKNLGNNEGLGKGFEEELHAAGDDRDERELQQERRKGVSERIVAVKQTLGADLSQGIAFRLDLRHHDDVGFHGCTPQLNPK